MIAEDCKSLKDYENVEILLSFTHYHTDYKVAIIHHISVRKNHFQIYISHVY